MGNSPNNPGVSRLHKDSLDNLYVVLQGRKSFSIFSPQHAQYMQTVLPTFFVEPGGYSYQLWLTLINDTLPATASFAEATPHFSAAASPNDPLLGPAQGMYSSFELNPGDMLYLPVGWFHQVSSFDRNFALNFWWEESRGEAKLNVCE
jgi:Cupin-like domain